MRWGLAFWVIAACAVAQPIPDPWKQPHGLVPDKGAAIKIAEAILFPIYGEKLIKGERPYDVDLKGGFWHIRGSLPSPPPGVVMFGGTFYITISQWDARVIEIGHEE